MLVLALTVCMAGSAFADSIPILYSRFAIDTNRGIPKVGESFTLTFKARSDYDMDDITVLVTVPDGIACLDDSTRYAVSCASGESTAIDVHLRCESPGPYHIQAHTLMSSAETLNFLQYVVTDFYISSQVDTALWADSLLPGLEEYNLYGGEPDTVQTLGPTLVNCNVHGTFQYQVKGTPELLKIRGLYIKLISTSGQTYSTTTDELGHYSITLPSGSYVFRAYSFSNDAEVHEGWQASANYRPPPGAVVRQRGRLTSSEGGGYYY